MARIAGIIGPDTLSAKDRELKDGQLEFFRAKWEASRGFVTNVTTEGDFSGLRGLKA